MQENRAFTHAGQGRDGGVLRAVVGELAVNLVGEHDEVVLNAQRGNPPEFLGGLRRARWIAREIEHQHFRRGCDFPFQLARGEPEVVFRKGRHRDWNAVREHNARTVADVTWLVVEHLFTKVEQRAQGEIDGFGNAYRDDDLARRVVDDAEVFRDV